MVVSVAAKELLGDAERTDRVGADGDDHVSGEPDAQDPGAADQHRPEHPPPPAETLDEPARHQRADERPDPDRLLPGSFTLRELRLVHEGVAGRELQRDSFRRAMERYLEPTGETVVRGPGRPAELFRVIKRDEP